MARATGRSSVFGSFFDSTLDRIGDGAIFGGLVLYFAGPGDNYLYLCLSLYCLVMGAVTSYARAKAESLGLDAKGGLAERADRLVAILVMTGLGALFGLPVLMYLTLWVLALANTQTVLVRVLKVRKQALAGAGGPLPAPDPAPLPVRRRVGSGRTIRVMADIPSSLPQSSPRPHLARQARHGRDAQGRCHHGRGHRRAGPHRRGGRRRRGDGPRAGPADIRAQGGVSRMSDPDMIDSIISTVSIPVDGQGPHRPLRRGAGPAEPRGRLHRRVRGAEPADYAHHIDKWAFQAPFVSGATNLGEALAPHHRGRGHDPFQGRGRHRRRVQRRDAHAHDPRRDPSPRGPVRGRAVRRRQGVQAPHDLVAEVARTGKLPVVLFTAGGIATPADAAMMMQLGAEGVFVGSGIFKSGTRSSGPRRSSRPPPSSTTDVVAKVREAWVRPWSGSTSTRSPSRTGCPSAVGDVDVSVELTATVGFFRQTCPSIATERSTHGPGVGAAAGEAPHRDLRCPA